MTTHHYKITNTWTGNTGNGTRDYKAYTRDHEISGEGKPVISGSSDPAFRGDPARYSPEDLLVAALSTCHMLSYLHQCAVNGVVVVAYTDNAEGVMEENGDGSGQLTSVTLRPRVTVSDASMFDKAQSLHTAASKNCFIARSVNFPVLHKPQVAGENPATQGATK